MLNTRQNGEQAAKRWAGSKTVKRRQNSEQAAKLCTGDETVNRQQKYEQAKKLWTLNKQKNGLHATKWSTGEKTVNRRWNGKQATKRSTGDKMAYFPQNSQQAPQLCSALFVQYVWTSISVLAEISLRSPRKLFSFIIKKYIYRIKVSKKIYYLISKKNFTGMNAFAFCASSACNVSPRIFLQNTDETFPGIQLFSSRAKLMYGYGVA